MNNIFPEFPKMRFLICRYLAPNLNSNPHFPNNWYISLNGHKSGQEVWLTEEQLYGAWNKMLARRSELDNVFNHEMLVVCDKEPKKMIRPFIVDAMVRTEQRNPSKLKDDIDQAIYEYRKHLKELY